MILPVIDKGSVKVESGGKSETERLSSHRKNPSETRSEDIHLVDPEEVGTTIGGTLKVRDSTSLSPVFECEKPKL